MARSHKKPAGGAFRRTWLCLRASLMLWHGDLSQAWPAPTKCRRAVHLVGAGHASEKGKCCHAQRKSMPKVLLRKSPSDFKTLPLHVEASPDGLSYQSLGRPLNFSEVIERRRPVSVSGTNAFAIELANLGVSVRLTLSWQGREYWVLVRQRRLDRGDVVLKLISGYVPAHEVNLPLLTAIQEIAEECLLETPEGWLAGRFDNTWLPTPYQCSLPYRETIHFKLASLSGAARPVHCGSQVLTERPRAYVHLPTASLQLIYDMRLEIPKEVRQLSLFHVDE